MAPSPYDELCEGIRGVVDAAGVVVIVFREKHGSGCSVRADPGLPAIEPVLPAMLRDLACRLERKLANDARALRKVVGG